MNEPVEVTAHFDGQGKVYPVRMVYRGQAYVIDSVGRRHQADDGLHILVMTDGWRVWDLVYNPGESRWYVHRRPGPIHA